MTSRRTPSPVSPLPARCGDASASAGGGGERDAGEVLQVARVEQLADVQVAGEPAMVFGRLVGHQLLQLR